MKETYQQRKDRLHAAWPVVARQEPPMTHEVLCDDSEWRPCTAMQAAAYRCDGVEVRAIEGGAA